MKKNKDKFLELISEKDTKTLEEIRWRIKNKWWLKIVKTIHLNYLILRDIIHKR